MIFNVTYKFLLTDKNKDSHSYKALRALFYLKLRKSNLEALTALSLWFENLPKSNSVKWFQQYETESSEEDSEVDQIIDDHGTWCKTTGIEKTPTIFINGKEMPNEYSISDLKYHLRSLGMNNN